MAYGMDQEDKCPSPVDCQCYDHFGVTSLKLTLMNAKYRNKSTFKSKLKDKILKWGKQSQSMSEQLTQEFQSYSAKEMKMRKKYRSYHCNICGICVANPFKRDCKAYCSECTKLQKNPDALIIPYQGFRSQSEKLGQLIRNSISKLKRKMWNPRETLHCAKCGACIAADLPKLKCDGACSSCNKPMDDFFFVAGACHLKCKKFYKCRRNSSDCKKPSCRCWGHLADDELSKRKSIKVGKKKNIKNRVIKNDKRENSEENEAAIQNVLGLDGKEVVFVAKCFNQCLSYAMCALRNIKTRENCKKIPNNYCKCDRLIDNLTDKSWTAQLVENEQEEEEEDSAIRRNVAAVIKDPILKQKPIISTIRGSPGNTVLFDKVCMNSCSHYWNCMEKSVRFRKYAYFCDHLPHCNCASLISDDMFLVSPVHRTQSDSKFLLEPAPEYHEYHVASLSPSIPVEEPSQEEEEEEQKNTNLENEKNKHVYNSCSSACLSYVECTKKYSQEYCTLPNDCYCILFD